MLRRFRLALMLIGLGCAAPTPEPECPPERIAAAGLEREEALFGEREIAAARSSPELRAHLMRDVHAFFRLVNGGFSRRVCERFAATMPVLPLVNLHGDLHLEQYAVTSEGRGLTDFDDAALGPPLLDFARLGVSIRLAARSRELDPSLALEAMLAGYRAALLDPETPVAEPAIVARLRERLSAPADFLAFAEGIMHPLDAEEASRLADAYRRYLDLMRSEHPEIDASFFALRRQGRLRSGIGSFLIPRYLLRLEGASPEADDDVVLEAKEVESIAATSCAQRVGGAWQVALTRARLGLGPDRFLAVIPIASSAASPFWFQSWRPDYRELDIRIDLKSAEELAEVAFDIGHRLGVGHVRYVGAPLESQLRRALLAAVDAFEKRLRAEVLRLSDEVTAAWVAFRGTLER